MHLHHEVLGPGDRPALVLVNGVGSQCINIATEWCERFVALGVRVVRMDNRDCGLSTKFGEDDSYSLADMAGDVVTVLDAVGAERAHVMGLSMGGMIGQRLAIDHPLRVLTLTSAMSTTGEPEYGAPTPEALAALLTAATARELDDYVRLQVEASHVYGSKPEWLDDARTAARARAAFERCFCPEGIGRQMLAVGRDGSRADGLRALRVPTLVVHGSRDRMVDPSGGRRTAELVPGARYHEIDGMGHDYPPAVWDEWTAVWAEFALPR